MFIKILTMPDVVNLVEGFTELLQHIKPNNLDGIPGKIWNFAAQEVAPVMNSLYQKSLDKGILPTSCASILPTK